MVQIEDLIGLKRLSGSWATSSTGWFWCSNWRDPQGARFANIYCSSFTQLSAGNFIRFLQLRVSDLGFRGQKHLHHPLQKSYHNLWGIKWLLYFTSLNLSGYPVSNVQPTVWWMTYGKAQMFLHLTHRKLFIWFIPASFSLAYCMEFSFKVINPICFYAHTAPRSHHSMSEKKAFLSFEKPQWLSLGKWSLSEQLSFFLSFFLSRKISGLTSYNLDPMLFPNFF